MIEIWNITDAVDVYTAFLLSTHARCLYIVYSLFVCLLVCTVTDFSAEDKDSGVNFFWAVHRRPRQGISHFLTLLSQKPKIGQIGQRAGHDHRDVNITIEMRWRKRHARDAPFVEYRAACGLRIGMCGYRSVPNDVLVLLYTDFRVWFLAR